MYVREPTEMYPVVLLIAAVCTVCTLIFRRRARKDATAQPRMQANATVTSTERHSEMAGRRCVYRYYAIFRLEDGTHRSFQVSEWEWNRLEEGDQGELTWQGQRFLFFTRR